MQNGIPVALILQKEKSVSPISTATDKRANRWQKTADESVPAVHGEGSGGRGTGRSMGGQGVAEKNKQILTFIRGHREPELNTS